MHQDILSDALPTFLIRYLLIIYFDSISLAILHPFVNNISFMLSRISSRMIPFSNTFELIFLSHSVLMLFRIRLIINSIYFSKDNISHNQYSFVDIFSLSCPSIILFQYSIIPFIINKCILLILILL